MDLREMCMRVWPSLLCEMYAYTSDDGIVCLSTESRESASGVEQLVRADQQWLMTDDWCTQLSLVWRCHRPTTVIHHMAWPVRWTDPWTGFIRDIVVHSSNSASRKMSAERQFSRNTCSTPVKRSLAQHYAQTTCDIHSPPLSSLLATYQFVLSRSY